MRTIRVLVSLSETMVTLISAEFASLLFLPVATFGFTAVVVDLGLAFDLTFKESFGTVLKTFAWLVV